MNKNLILVILLAGLVGLTLFIQQQQTSSDSSGLQPGDALVSDLDLSKLHTVQIAGPDGANTVTSSEDGWVVSDLNDYPVKFEKLSELISKLEELKVGQTISSGSGDVSEFGLKDKATTITLKDKSGNVLADYIIGTSRESGNGKYMLAGENEVVLVDEDFFGLATAGEDWIEKKILDVSSTDIKAIQVAGPDSRYTLKVDGGSTYSMDGLSEDQEINKTPAGRLARGIQYFNINSVEDPALPEETTGFAKGWTYQATTKNDVTYTLTLGSEQDDNRFLKIDAAYTKPAAPTEADAATRLGPKPEDQSDEDRAAAVKERLEQLQKKHEEAAAEAESEVQRVKELGQWLYTITSYNAESLTFPRDKVVKAKEKKPEEAKTGPVSPTASKTKVRSVTTPPVQVPPPPPKPSPKPEVKKETKPAPKPEVKIAPKPEAVKQPVKKPTVKAAPKPTAKIKAAPKPKAPAKPDPKLPPKEEIIDVPIEVKTSSSSPTPALPAGKSNKP